MTRPEAMREVQVIANPNKRIPVTRLGGCYREEGCFQHHRQLGRLPILLLLGTPSRVVCPGGAAAIQASAEGGTCGTRYCWRFTFAVKTGIYISTSREVAALRGAVLRINQAGSTVPSTTEET